MIAVCVRMKVVKIGLKNRVVQEIGDEITGKYIPWKQKLVR